MNDDFIPQTNLEHFLPGMTRDFKDYVDVLPPEREIRHPGEDQNVRDLAIHISNLIEKSV